jgi:hypothetical protein
MVDFSQRAINPRLLSFAPSHDLLATETAVGTINDPGLAATFARGQSCAAITLDIADGKRECPQLSLLLG